MSRVTWFAAGVAAGAYGLLKARRTARNFTPDGVAARAAALGAGFRVFTSEVSVGMAQRESELREQLTPPPAVPSADAPAMIEQPTETRQGREDITDGHR